MAKHVKHAHFFYIFIFFPLSLYLNCIFIAQLNKSVKKICKLHIYKKHLKNFGGKISDSVVFSSFSACEVNSDVI